MSMSGSPDALQDNQGTTTNYRNAILLDRAKTQWKNLFSWPTSPTNLLNTKPGRRQPSILTLRNQRTNEPWGNILSGNKTSNLTRVYMENVNGLSIDRRGGQLNDVCEVIQETQANIFCGQEHNLDVTQMRIRSILYDTVRQYWD